MSDRFIQRGVATLWGFWLILLVLTPRTMHYPMLTEVCDGINWLLGGLIVFFLCAIGVKWAADRSRGKTPPRLRKHTLSGVLVLAVFWAWPFARDIISDLYTWLGSNRL